MNTPSAALHDIHLTVKVQTPFLIQGNHPGQFGLDAVQMMNAERQRIIPGTLLAGRIIDAWKSGRKEFNLDLPNPKDWFATRPKSTHETPFERARIMVSDLRCTTSQPDTLASTANRIRIDNDTQAVEHGALMLIEQGEAARSTLSFKGIWRVWLECQEEKDRLQHALHAGLLWHNQLGALRSVGFGQLEDVDLEILPALPLAPSDTPLSLVQAHSQGICRQRIALRFDRPLCVSTQNRRGNVFVSSDIISGGTLKGALATMLDRQYKDWKKDPSLLKAFSALRITHALPAADRSQRPIPLPLSLVSDNDTETPTLWDVVLCTSPMLLPGNKAPAFQTDWKGKSWQKAQENQNWGETKTELRVRTAIENGKAKVTEDGGALFAYECKIAKENTCWLADICLNPADPDQRPLLGLLDTLLVQGLGPIGKTDAWATVSDLPDTQNVWQSETEDAIQLHSGFFILQLVTPALLFSTRRVANQLRPDLLAIYQEAFASLSDSTLQLSHFFANQSMAGGEFLWHKYISSKKNYQPYILSDAGSVFVFTATDTHKARLKLNEWIQNGLPLPDSVKNEHGDTWSENPFVPENGYGEVIVNLRHGIQPLPQTANSQA